MKNLFKIIIINLVLISLFSFLVTAISCTGMPDSGSTFYGYAKYGSSVLTGETVTATTDDGSVSGTTESDGSYRIVVGRCPGSSETVTFTVCTRAAGTGNYSAGMLEAKEQNLTISSACPSAAAPSGGGGGGGAGGGGGGGAAAVTPSVINLDLKPDFLTDEGYTASQTQGNTATFTIGGVKYTIELTTLRDDSVTIDVAGQSKVLEIGETAEFDVDGDGINDISITLVSIDGGRAELLYKRLAAPEEPVEEVEEVEEVKPPVVVPPPKKPIGWIIVGAVVVIGLIAYFAVIKKKKPELPA